jgi:hypothetical protein
LPAEQEAASSILARRTTTPDPGFGQPSAANAEAFNTAANNPTAVGLSFGGGCFFENGVGTTDGSGSFTLTNFSN